MDMRCLHIRVGVAMVTKLVRPKHIQRAKLKKYCTNKNVCYYDWSMGTCAPLPKGIYCDVRGETGKQPNGILVGLGDNDNYLCEGCATRLGLKW